MSSALQALVQQWREAAKRRQCQAKQDDRCGYDIFAARERAVADAYTRCADDLEKALRDMPPEIPTDIIDRVVRQGIRELGEMGKT